MLKLRHEVKSNSSGILLWFALCSCVLFFATTSRFSFVLISDKVTHASVFCLLLLVLGWQANGWRKLVLVFIGLSLIGCVIELAQTLVPHRHPSLSDVMANTVGLVCGICIALLYRTQQLSALILANSMVVFRMLRRFNSPKKPISHHRTWSDPNPYIARSKR